MSKRKKGFSRNLRNSTNENDIELSKEFIISGDSYFNKQLGLFLTKPEKWEFVRIGDFDALKRDHVQSSEFPHENGSIEVLRDPVLAIAKYGMYKREFSGKFSPSITVYAFHKNEITEFFESKYAKGNSQKVFNILAYRSKRIFKNYRMIRALSHYDLSRYAGFDAEWGWTFESARYKKSWECKTWSIAIEKKEHLIFFNMTDSNEAGEIEFENFLRFVNTVILK